MAKSMVEMVTQFRIAFSHPLQAFICYWAAFNNIYVTIAERLGSNTELRKNADGSLQTKTVSGTTCVTSMVRF